MITLAYRDRLALIRNGGTLFGDTGSGYGSSVFTGAEVFDSDASIDNIIDDVTAGISAGFENYTTVNIDDLGAGLAEGIGVCTSADIGDCIGTGTTGRLVALLPEDPAAWREHAAVSGATGQYEAAKAIYDEALSPFDADAELFRGRSIVNVRLGQLEAADADATRAADLVPGWPEPRFLLGEIERAKGHGAAAEEAFRAALALDADHWPSLVNLAALRLEAGDTEQALTLAQQAVELSGGAAAATDMLQKAQGGQ